MDSNVLRQPDDQAQAFDAQGVDVTEDSPLPDVPDAGADSLPLVPPEPVDISTDRLNIDAALVAGTLDEGEGRTLYEQAIDAYEESDARNPPAVTPQRRAGDRRARIYDSER
ncbi:MAG TPA: hypothetical protein VFZ66_26050 [Herpetosiphonaceae bacterium]